MLFSSTSPSSALVWMDRGSNAIPQIGQSPGASRSISGCIGHVQIVFNAATGVAGSSDMPHFGQSPGRSLSTPSHIEQTYFPAPVDGADRRPAVRSSM